MPTVLYLLYWYTCWVLYIFVRGLDVHYAFLLFPIGICMLKRYSKICVPTKDKDIIFSKKCLIKTFIAGQRYSSKKMIGYKIFTTILTLWNIEISMYFDKLFECSNFITEVLYNGLKFADQHCNLFSSFYLCIFW